jgi:four helix bundle protein
MIIQSYRELRVYQAAMDAAMDIFQFSKSYPAEEKYSLTDQMRRSSRSVCANIGEAWRKRRYRAAFIAKISDAETEACETQIWLEFALRCNYLEEEKAKDLTEKYDHILSQLVIMIHDADKWVVKSIK